MKDYENMTPADFAGYLVEKLLQLAGFIRSHALNSRSEDHTDDRNAIRPKVLKRIDNEIYELLQAMQDNPTGRFDFSKLVSDIELLEDQAGRSISSARRTPYFPVYRAETEIPEDAMIMFEFTVESRVVTRDMIKEVFGISYSTIGRYAEALAEPGLIRIGHSEHIRNVGRWVDLYSLAENGEDLYWQTHHVRPYYRFWDFEKGEHLHTLGVNVLRYSMGAFSECECLGVAYRSQAAMTLTSYYGGQKSDLIFDAVIKRNGILYHCEVEVGNLEIDFLKKLPRCIWSSAQHVLVLLGPGKELRNYVDAVKEMHGAAKKVPEQIGGQTAFHIGLFSDQYEGVPPITVVVGGDTDEPIVQKGF
jgi:hypothetical protein